MGYEQYLFTGKTVPSITVGETLKYPVPTNEDRELYRSFLSNPKTPTGAILWTQLRLYLLQPDWLFNADGKTKRSRIRSRVSEETFKHVFEGVAPWKKWVDNPNSQIDLLLTASACKSCGEEYFSGRLLRQIKKHPFFWQFAIDTAGWLIEELQVDAEDSPLANWLYEIRDIQFEKLPDMEQQVSFWLQCMIEEDSQRL